MDEFEELCEEQYTLGKQYIATRPVEFCSNIAKTFKFVNLCVCALEYMQAWQFIIVVYEVLYLVEKYYNRLLLT
jgi:hypothetical protein